MSLKQNDGFMQIIALAAFFVVLCLAGYFFYSKNSKSLDKTNPVSETPGEQAEEHAIRSERKMNHYLGVPCESKEKVEFTHDFTDVNAIAVVEPTIITPGSSRIELGLI